MTEADLADVAPTPGDLLGRVAFARRVADDAEAEVLELAVEWAHSHPVVEGEAGWDAGVSWRTGPAAVWQPGEYDASVAHAGDPEVVEWCGIPPVAWDAPAAFAAACGMATTAGKALIRDALVLRHRLPLIWARVRAGEVQAWRARRVAQAVLGAHHDVVAAVDAAVVAIADRVGPVTLARIVDEQLLRLHAEEREVKQLEDLDARYVRLQEGSINDTGIADLMARGDWKDLHDLDATLTALAAALKAQGCTESLDVRRSMALGILADPAAAHAMLTDEAAPAPTRKQVVVHLHLSEAALGGREVIGRNATTGQPVLAEQIRAWCSRTDTHVVVKPVIDLTDHAGAHVEAYEVPDRLKDMVALLHPQCVFPWCTRPASRCDADHTRPHAHGGPTCICNLATLCRHHHNLKTHTAWTYHPLDPLHDPGVYLLTDPHGLQYLRSPTGTTSLTPAGLQHA
jgi:hypothetical protein